MLTAEIVASFLCVVIVELILRVFYNRILLLLVTVIVE